MTGTILTEEQMTYYDEAVKQVIRHRIVGRNLIALAPGSPFGFGVQQVDYNTLNDMSPAQLSMKLTESTDIITTSNGKIEIPIIHKEFEIDRRDLLSSQRNGTPLDTTTARVAAEQVAILEDTMIIQGGSLDGGSTYKFPGLYQGAGNSYSTASDFGTAGNAIDAVKGAVQMLLDDAIYPPYNMVINQEQYAEILGPRSTTSDKTELAIVKDILRGGDGDGRAGELGTGAGGYIFVSDVITAGTGLVAAAPNGTYADLAVSQDVVTEFETIQKTGNTFGRVFEAMVPRILKSNAFCKLTSI